MRILNLMEDTSGKDDFYFEHGLSFYVETENNKFLVDTGTSEKTWLNAKRLNINLKEIDFIILSHGHYDHSGGILSFVEKNPNFALYINTNATGYFYNLRNNIEKYIGIDRKIIDLPQCVWLNPNNIKDRFIINDEISLFFNVIGRRQWPQSNTILKEKIENSFIQDKFKHEQYVVVENNNKKILISGCAHNGILNILDKFQKIYNCKPDIVISGFHMMKKTIYTDEELQLIKDIAYELKQSDIIFYTGHCTGLTAFNIMNEIMGDNLRYIHSGDELSL